MVNHLLHFKNTLLVVNGDDGAISRNTILVINGDDGDGDADAMMVKGKAGLRQHTFQFRVRTCNSTKLETCFRFRI